MTEKGGSESSSCPIILYNVNLLLTGCSSAGSVSSSIYETKIGIYSDVNVLSFKRKSFTLHNGINF
jgi:hypothetical protein